MLWVGGGIMLHGAHELGLHAPSDAAEAVRRAVELGAGALGGVLGWLSYAVIALIAGTILGAATAYAVHVGQKATGWGRGAN